LRAEENQHAAQLKRGEKLVAQCQAENKKYPALSSKAVALREQPKK